MESFVSGDEFIGKGKSGHQWSFFKPENGTKWAWKENAFNSCKGDQPLLESPVSVHPLHRPLRLFFDHLNIGDGWKQVILLVEVLDVGINKERVGLRVHVFHRNLKAIKASGLRDLYLRAKLLCQIFKDDPIWGSEKGEDVFDEVFLLLVEFLPVLEVLVEVNLICSPEGSQMLFVHFVDGVVLDGEQHKPLRVLGQDRLFLLDGGKGGTHANSNDYIASLIAVINQIGRQFNFDLEIVLLNFGKIILVH